MEQRLVTATLGQQVSPGHFLNVSRQLDPALVEAIGTPIPEGGMDIDLPTPPNPPLNF